MLKCPQCKKGNTIVIDSRDNGESVRRRRECLKCKFRHTTYEAIEKKEEKETTEIFSAFVCDYCMHDCKDIRGHRGCSKFSGKKLYVSPEEATTPSIIKYGSKKHRRWLKDVQEFAKGRQKINRKKKNAS